MFRNKINFTVISVLLLLIITIASVYGQQDAPGMRKLMVFFSPACHRCIEVKKELIPAIEKIFKAAILKRGETFKFIHDLNMLFQQIFGSDYKGELLEKVSFVNSLYPMLRYPTGSRITKEQAGKCLEIAKAVFNELKIGK